MIEWHACAFCVALQRVAIRRRDPALLDAAIRLREEHAINDAEREAFARRQRVSWPTRHSSLTSSPRRR